MVRGGSRGEDTLPGSIIAGPVGSHTGPGVRRSGPRLHPLRGVVGPPARRPTLYNGRKLASVRPGSDMVPGVPEGEDPTLTPLPRMVDLPQRPSAGVYQGVR